MRASSLLLPAVLMVLSGCGGSASPSGAAHPSPALLSHGQITAGGRHRTYRLYRPGAVDPHRAAPLVLILHGNGSNGDQMANTTEFDTNADAGGFIAVYPDGIERSWNGSFCCEPAPTLGTDDVAFLNALIAHLEQQYTIDAHRVFITGFSSGAIMAFRYACQGSVPLAAIAPVAGTMLLTTDCHPRQATSVLAINGTEDGEVPFQGGHLPPGASATDTIVPPISDVVTRWARIDGCGGVPLPSSDGSVTLSRWPGCSSGAEVQLEAITGAGHTWYAPGFGPVDGAIDASKVVAAFFSSVH